MKALQYSRSICILACLGFLFHFNTIIAQYTNCDYNRTLTGIPASSQTREVENIISSDQTIVPPHTVTYDAGNFMTLDQGFRVMDGAIFQAELDGCERECEPRQEMCESDCPEGFDLKFTETDQPYIQNQVVLTFPDEITSIEIQSPFLFLNGQTFNISDTMYKYMDVNDPNNNSPGMLSRCLCDRNIILYENENIIFDEGAVKRRNSSVSGASAEGGVYSLNYVLETNETPLPMINDEDAQTKEGNLQAVTVAILDTGLDVDLIPDGSVYFNPNSFVCLSMNDQLGWNFIDNNNDISDVRGHGSLVTLSYLEAFQNMEPAAEIFDQQILTVKVLNDCGQGTTYSTLCGLRYCLLYTSPSPRD